MTRRGRPYAANSLFLARAVGAAALWLASGLLLGLTLGGSPGPWVGVPLLLVCAAAGAAVLPPALPQSEPVREDPPSEENGASAACAAMALAVTAG